MELRNRDLIERGVADELQAVSDRHRRELRQLLGTPPDPRNVPPEFWARVRREEEDAITPALFAVFFAAAAQHGKRYGLPSAVAQQAASEWSILRARTLAGERADTSRELLGQAAKEWAEQSRETGPPSRSEINGRIDQIFGPDRSTRMGVSETTHGSFAGGEFAMRFLSRLDPKDTWFTERDDSVCPKCAPLHRMWRSATDAQHPIAWESVWPDGPPRHPNCRCHISYVADREDAAAVKNTNLYGQKILVRLRQEITALKGAHHGAGTKMDPKVAKLQEKYGLPDELQGRPLSEFVLFEDVPLIDTFEDVDINATPEFLQKVVRVNNERTLDTGDMAPLILGHTDEDLAEKDQPPIVGWALDYKLQPQFGRLKPRPAVLGSMLIHKSLADTIRQKFPRRSVEVFSDGTIDPIALLGATAPRRSLTLLEQPKRSVALKKNQFRWRFSASAMCADGSTSQSTQGVLAMDDQTKKEISDMIEAAIGSSPLGKLAAKLMEQDPSLVGGDPVAGDPPPVDPSQLDNGVTAETDMASIIEELVAAATEDEVKLALAKLRKARSSKLQKQQKTTGTNDDAVRLEINQLKTRLARSEARSQQLEAREQEHATKLRHKERETELIQLESEGYEFDLKDEFEHVKDMPDAQFAAHLKRIAANYRRVPLGGSSLVKPAMLRREDPDDKKLGRGDAKKLTPQEEDRRIKLAKAKRQESYSKNGVRMSMVEALREVEAELEAAASNAS